MIKIQQEINEMCKLKKYLPNDLLEAYIDYAALYSQKNWLLLLSERLRRMELEIAII